MCTQGEIDRAVAEMAGVYIAVAASGIASMHVWKRSVHKL